MTAVAILRPGNFTELMQFAQAAAKSSMVPEAYKGKPENIMLAVQMGSELGLAPMQSIQNIAVIGGRPAVFGDALIGLCRQSPLCDDIQERMDGTGDDMVATCAAKRKGATPVTARFSVRDAKQAGLWGKQGPWSAYPARMLQHRARGFALRDAFPDVLRGLLTVEEARDIPFDGTTIDAKPELVSVPDPTPDPPKRQTAREWLDETQGLFHLADTPEAVEALIASERVQTGLAKLTNGGLAALREMIDNARRDAPTEEEAPF